MFKYTSDFSELTHYIIKTFVNDKVTAVDGTLGNGYDTDFLSNNFKNVISFDIQKEACEKYMLRGRENVKIVNESHENIKKHVESNISCIIYNLGFLPGGDKTITTTKDSSLKSIEDGLDLLASEGLMLITSYRGHDEGLKEFKVISEYLSDLPKSKYAVMKHEIINRSEFSPVLFVVEKK